MKEDKEKEERLEAVKKELNQKIEAIMGPTSEDRPAEGKEMYHQDEGDKNQPSPMPEPKTAPVVSTTPDAEQAKSGQPAPIEAKTELANEPEPKADPKLDEAVDDIAANESDEVLKAEDEEVKKAFDGKKEGFLTKLKNFFKDLWANPKKRAITIASIVLVFVALSTVPNSRYFVLNSVGIRSSASLKVLDESTQQPLKNVKVSLDGQSGITNDEGYIKLDHLRLGRSEIKIERRAFAVFTKNLTVGWGSNPLGDFRLTPVGLQYTFHVADFLSGKPIFKAEAINGDASAFANEQGEVVLTLDTKDDQDVLINISAEGYREEEVTMTAQEGTTKDIKMAPATKHVFVSKRSGKYDIYKIDADGKNEELVLRGTGYEKDDMVLATHPDRNVAALVSTRENMQNTDGYLLSTLTIIDLETNEKENIGRSERFQVIGWSGERLIYVKVMSGTSAANPKRQRLMSYNYTNGETKEIASSNYFNDVMLSNDKIYYAPSSAYQNGINVSLFGIDPNGDNKQVLVENETWNLFRTGYEELTIAVGEAWYKYNTSGTESPQALNGAPADPESRIYVNNPNKKLSSWIDERDGKGVILVYDTEKKEDKNIISQSGLSNPARWLNNSTLVYRVSNSTDTSDFVVSVDGGEPKKLVDVTATAGIERWYYY